ncbi:hypothetical protein GW17_00036694 [Ensete ventricosum]|nr:hypothetical protein GW17_00036694 [Ensete ventricosum]
MGKSFDSRRRHDWQRKRRTMVGSSRQITKDRVLRALRNSAGHVDAEARLELEPKSIGVPRKCQPRGFSGINDDMEGTVVDCAARVLDNGPGRRYMTRGVKDHAVEMIADREEGSPLLRLEGSVGSMVRRKCSATNVRRGAGSWEIGVASSRWYGGRRKKVAGEGSLSLDRWRGQSLRDALEAKVRGPIYGKGAQCEGWKQSQKGGGRGRVQCDQSWRWSGQSHMVKEEDRIEREGWGRSMRRRNRALKCRALFVDFGTSSTFSEARKTSNNSKAAPTTTPSAMPSITPTLLLEPLILFAGGKTTVNTASLQ